MARYESQPDHNDSCVIYLWEALKRLCEEHTFECFTSDQGICLRSKLPGMLPDNILFAGRSIAAAHSFLVGWAASRQYLLIEKRAKRRGI
jgi:hypothetical protein